MWCHISGEDAGEIWTWSLLGVEGSTATADRITLIDSRTTGEFKRLFHHNCLITDGNHGDIIGIFSAEKNLNRGLCLTNYPIPWGNCKLCSMYVIWGGGGGGCTWGVFALIMLRSFRCSVYRGVGEKVKEKPRVSDQKHSAGAERGEPLLGEDAGKGRRKLIRFLAHIRVRLLFDRFGIVSTRTLIASWAHAWSRTVFWFWRSTATEAACRSVLPCDRLSCYSDEHDREFPSLKRTK